MRRLASVFVASSRRADKSDVPADDAVPSPSRLVRSRSRVFPSLSRKHLSSFDPPSLVASDLANSSSSSSSGSTTLRTPDDDGLPRTPSKKGSWKSWLGGKNTAASDLPEGRHSPPWKSSRDVLHPSQSGSNEADDTSLQSDDPYGNSNDVHTPSSYSPEQMATARANARTLIMNSLVREPTAPPLYHSSDAISFPRSCHSYRRLPRRETLESELHKKSLLIRLERLSPSAELSIAPFASRSISPNHQAQRNFQDDVFLSADSVGLRSRSLEKWVLRSCFEDRLQVWTRSDSGEIIRTRIPGSHFGVAALEFSDSLELLAGTLQESYEDPEVEMASASEFTLPPLSLNLDPPTTPKRELGSGPLSLPSELSQPMQLSLSPQLGSTSFGLCEVPPSAQPAKGTTTSGSTVTSDPAPKRGVRFADDDGKDDQIPLGYVLRIRKNKEQKAQFLRQERERRERAARLSMENRRATAPPQEHRVSRVTAPQQRPVRPLISLNEAKSPRPPSISHVVREEERLRLEAEKVEMEKLRRSREMARRQAEERERNYTEELHATRARREAFRAGRPLESASLSTRIPDRDRSASRDSIHASFRKSSTSHMLTPELVFSPVSPLEGSPSSSVPATPGSQHSFSRPPSLYSAHTTSSEDVRGRDGRCASRRMSVVSDPSKGMLLHLPYDPRASFNPYAWTNVPQVPVIPPVPPMPAIPMVNGVPFYGIDQPLLPPTAPFMMNQFGIRSRSSLASTGQQSPLQSSTVLPRNYSSEGVNSSSRNSSPHSSGSHQRRSSDDATRMNTLGECRSGTYADVRGGKTTGSMRVALSQRSPQRSSWLLPEESAAKKSSSLRPVSGTYSSGSPVHMRRRTAAS